MRKRYYRMLKLTFSKIAVSVSSQCEHVVTAILSFLILEILVEGKTMKLLTHVLI